MTSIKDKTKAQLFAAFTEAVHVGEPCELVLTWEGGNMSVVELRFTQEKTT